MHVEFQFNGESTKIKLIPTNPRERSLCQLALTEGTRDCKWSVSMPKPETEIAEPYIITITYQKV